MIKEIHSGDRLAALFISNKDIEPGTHPITDSANALQALMMHRPAGHVFAKHTHDIRSRATDLLQEVIVVTEGSVLVTVCDREGNDIVEQLVSAGECLYVVEGGFRIDVVEDARFYEFKNGPHEEDKILL